jgi:hypothetical protein
MIKYPEYLRPKLIVKPYPKYHTGDYFEEFFFKKIIEDNPNLEINGYKYLPIFWTNCYVNKTFSDVSVDIQSYLDTLDPNDKYFMISQHADCYYENIPENTIVFSMGGNKVGKNVIPIPLICSPIVTKEREKDILFSFVGSNTHPVRLKIAEHFNNDPDFLVYLKSWSIGIKDIELELFIEVISRTKFTLCPRGYGKTSFRLYESIQMDSVPVYITDETWLPWENEIDWNESIIIVHPDNFKDIKNIILNTDYDSKVKNLRRIYKDYLTYDRVYYNIIKLLKNDNFSV